MARPLLIMPTLPPPAEIPLTLESFKEWLHAADKKIVDTVKDCNDELDQIGKSIAEFKKLFFEVRSEVEVKWDTKPNFVSEAERLRLNW
jgi:hypothetical protein